MGSYSIQYEKVNIYHIYPFILTPERYWDSQRYSFFYSYSFILLGWFLPLITYISHTRVYQSENKSHIKQRKPKTSVLLCRQQLQLSFSKIQFRVRDPFGEILQLLLSSTFEACVKVFFHMKREGFETLSLPVCNFSIPGNCFCKTQNPVCDCVWVVFFLKYLLMTELASLSLSINIWY